MRVLSTLPTAPTAASGLVLGYLVADLTGVRAVGGVVLFAALAFCAWQWRSRVGPSRTAVLVGIYLALFAGSHLLALVIGAWPSVFVVAALMFLAAAVLADRAGTPTDGARESDVQARSD